MISNEKTIRFYFLQNVFLEHIVRIQNLQKMQL
jgi:hypothetical protein